MKLSDHHSKQRKKIILIAVYIWLGAFLLYAPSLRFGFVDYDDTNVLLNHPQLYNEHSFISSLREIIFDYYPREEPLIIRDITWAIDSYLYGFKNPFGYHFGNVLINACNVLLVFLWFLMLTRNLMYSVVLGVSFGVLPVHVEPVCWVMGRKDMLVTFFMLISFIAHTAYLQTNTSSLKTTYYIIILFSVTAALLSKINAIAFFSVVFLYELFYPNISQSSKELELYRINKQFIFRMIPLVVITFVVYKWYQNILREWGLFNRGVDSLSITHIKNLFLFTPIVIAIYLKLIVLPYDFSIYYNWPSIYYSLKPFKIISSVCFMLILIATAIYLFKNRKDLFFFYIGFFLLMIPYFNIVYIGIWVADRYIYFTSCFILAMAILIIMDFLENQTKTIKNIAVGFWVVWVSVNIGITLYHQQKWRDALSLWTYEYNRKEPSHLSYASLADTYMELAENESDSNKRNDWLNRAETVLINGLNKLHQDTPSNPEISNLFYLYSILSEKKGESIDKQLSYCIQAFEIQPEFPRILRRLGILYRRKAMMAENESEKEIQARQSLIFFEKLARLVQDLRTRQKLVSVLEYEYESTFPFLKTDIQNIKRMLLKQ